MTRWIQNVTGPLNPEQAGAEVLAAKQAKMATVGLESFQDLPVTHHPIGFAAITLFDEQAIGTP